MELIGFILFTLLVLIGCFSGVMVIFIGWILDRCEEDDNWQDT